MGLFPFDESVHKTRLLQNKTIHQSNHTRIAVCNHIWLSFKSVGTTQPATQSIGHYETKLRRFTPGHAVCHRLLLLLASVDVSATGKMEAEIVGIGKGAGASRVFSINLNF